MFEIIIGLLILSGLIYLIDKLGKLDVMIDYLDKISNSFNPKTTDKIDPIENVEPQKEVMFKEPEKPSDIPIEERIKQELKKRGENESSWEWRRNSSSVCGTLFWRLSDQGHRPAEVNRLVKDVFNLLRDGGSFTVPFINHELENMGWPENMMDEYSFELIISLLETEFDYKINTHIIE